MFFHIVLERNMQLHPRHFGRDLREKLVAKLMKDVEGTCSGRHGFVVAITGIESVGKGLIRDGTGFVTFPVKYQCVVFRPFKGEILEAVVTMVNKMGFFAEAGPVQIFVSNHVVLMQVKIEKESEVRLKIIGTRVDATEIVCRSEEVFNRYREMNCIPWFTYTYVLKACIGSETLGWLLLRGKEIQAHMSQHGYEAHVHSFEALELFPEMMMLETLASVPNSVTMVSVPQACAALAALEQVAVTVVSGGGGCCDAADVGSWAVVADV
ncbi:hypothetical protein RHMOL_Rhmol10G0233600 [Rhododendron molle]|uniref:Uncharacterized protein n=1 Tax=Rhododendron molle TaxID=49168 RepID=A0ACC0M5L5_RHOML|nr:hypothetical protein RHMOL_Rhmol10G0233600 [Rhododendron molle]